MLRFCCKNASRSAQNVSGRDERRRSAIGAHAGVFERATRASAARLARCSWARRGAALRRTYAAKWATRGGARGSQGGTRREAAL
jgi:hypothetical protein